MGINKYTLALFKTCPFLCIPIFNHKKAPWEKNTQFLSIFNCKKHNRKCKELFCEYN